MESKSSCVTDNRIATLNILLGLKILLHKSFFVGNLVCQNKFVYTEIKKVNYSVYVPNGDVLLKSLWEVHEVKIMKAEAKSTPLVLG